MRWCARPAPNWHRPCEMSWRVRWPRNFPVIAVASSFVVSPDSVRDPGAVGSPGRHPAPVETPRPPARTAGAPARGDPRIPGGPRCFIWGMVTPAVDLSTLSLHIPIRRFCMQVKLNLIAGAALITLGAAAYAQDMVVKIGHVGPTRAASPTWARTTKTALAWPSTSSTPRA